MSDKTIESMDYRTVSLEETRALSPFFAELLDAKEGFIFLHVKRVEDDAEGDVTGKMRCIISATADETLFMLSTMFEDLDPGMQFAVATHLIAKVMQTAELMDVKPQGEA